MDTILKSDAVLYVDVTCWHCERLVALSNTVQFDGRYYCYVCSLDYTPHPRLTDLVALTGNAPADDMAEQVWKEQSEP